MYKIKLLNRISPKGLEVFSGEKYVVSEKEDYPDGILVRSYQMHNVPLSKTVKAVARVGAGINNIPVEGYSNNGIVVFSTPGANANAVKELVINSLFLSARNIIDAVQWTKRLEGEYISEAIERGKKEFIGTELYGKTIGVVGLGAIGTLLANTLLQLGMKVIGYDPYISVETAWNLSREIERARNLEHLLQKSDYVTIHVPLTEETRGMFQKDIFSMMKKGTVFLNFSRGELVNERDLKDAIDEEIIKNYLTDFPTRQLLKTEKVTSFPHLGASTYEAEENCAVMAANQMKTFLETGNIISSVNFPNTELLYVGKRRITIAHQNIPNMVGQITSVLAADGINIAEMINRSKGDIAYTIIDIDNHQDEVISTKHVKGIHGVMAVRVI